MGAGSPGLMVYRESDEYPGRFGGRGRLCSWRFGWRTRSRGCSCVGFYGLCIGERSLHWLRADLWLGRVTGNLLTEVLDKNPRIRADGIGFWET